MINCPCSISSSKRRLKFKVTLKEVKAQRNPWEFINVRILIFFMQADVRERRWSSWDLNKRKKNTPPREKERCMSQIQSKPFPCLDEGIFHQRLHNRTNYVLMYSMLRARFYRNNNNSNRKKNLPFFHITAVNIKMMNDFHLKLDLFIFCTPICFCCCCSCFCR